MTPWSSILLFLKPFPFNLFHINLIFSVFQLHRSAPQLFNLLKFKELTQKSLSTRISVDILWKIAFLTIDCLVKKTEHVDSWTLSHVNLHSFFLLWRIVALQNPHYLLILTFLFRNFIHFVTTSMDLLNSTIKLQIFFKFFLSFEISYFWVLNNFALFWNFLMNLTFFGNPDI